MITLFWISVSILAYHMFGYGAILFVITKAFRTSKEPEIHIGDDLLPTITVVCAAFNEEAVIGEKIESFLALDYPHEKIQLLIISDDSTDQTNDIVQKYSDRRVELVIQKPRRGKQSAHNLVRERLESDFILSTDANSMFEPQAVRYLVSTMLSNPKIGIVSGRLCLTKSGSKESGEGLYWKYESYLKELDNDFYSIIGSNGSIYLIRRDLFNEIDPSSVDDFERTLSTLKTGYLAKYQKQAVVSEEVTTSANQEINRKIRIISREWFVLGNNSELLNCFKYPQISFMLFSHKILRWLFFAPAIAIFISTMALSSKPFFKVLFILQAIGYTIGIIELMAQRKKKHIPGSGLPAYITAMVYASMVSFLNLLRNKNSAIWNPQR